MIRFGVDGIDTAEGARFIRIPASERPYYRPFYVPWRGADAHFERLWSAHGAKSMLNRERLWILYGTLQHVCSLDGEIWEAGTYQGGTARFIREVRDSTLEASQVCPPILRLFDTFDGMPDTDPARDAFRAGAFADTSVGDVRAFVGGENVSIHQGLIPQSFESLSECRLRWLHIDVDLYKSVRETLAFAWPRMRQGGVVVIDDYGFPNARGCRDAVDEFFCQRSAFPLVLSTGQALVWKTD